MDATLEVLTVDGDRQQNRKWPDELKARIVAETFRPGASVAAVARRHGLQANHVSSWRTMARQGKLVLPAPEDGVEFAAMVVAPPVPEKAAAASGTAEIIMGSAMIRLEAGASAERIAAIVHALAAPT
ncbi:Transposase [Roseivivax sp. THAF40]|uniref:IS66-like element accessory protein TnpA n=1 Tax=Roseivivax sp. THAF40 TaxID=2587858 RepID=UPI0012693E0A|nr:transposase [Roseivivax sp. THAF40]QFT47408.1 Transposase [Roseivivax sp. THAF40]